MRPSSWRLILSGPCEAAYNMAMDEALAISARCGGPATLRLYTWQAPSVTLGAFQRAGDVDMEFCASNNITVVRRPTGGRAILHTREELTYGFSAPTAEGPFSRGLFESYALLGGAFGRAFRAAGLKITNQRSRRAISGRNPLCFKSASYAETSVAGRKIIGSAQRRWSGAMLQQGSIPYAIDRDLSDRVFRGGLRHDLDTAMCGIMEAGCAMSGEQFANALVRAFEESFDVSLMPSAPTPEEEQRASGLIRDKYRSDRWTLRK